MDALTMALARFVAIPEGDEPICPPKTFEVSPDARIILGPDRGTSLLDGVTFAAWVSEEGK
ncbi:hypothetical protein [Mycolicibacterium sp. XJ1904]